MSTTARRLLLVAVSIACVLAGTPAGAHAAAPEPTLTGTLRTADGQPITNALVTVSVEPPAERMLELPAGAEVSATEVGWAWSFEDGTFHTWISDTASLLAAKDEDGLISLLLTSPTDHGQVFYRNRVTIGDDGVMRPFEADVAADGDLAERRPSLSLMAASDSGRPVFDLVSIESTPDEDPPTLRVARGSQCPAGSVCATGADTVAASAADPPRTDQPAFDASVTQRNALASASGRTFDPDIWCGGNHWMLKKSRDTIGRNVAIADQATRGHSTAGFEYKTSKNTSLEIGVTNRAGSLVSTLGMTKGATTTATIRGTIPKNTRAEWYISYGFNLYDVWCQNRTTGAKWWSGYTEYRAKGFTGNANRRLWTPFTCNSDYRNTIGSGLEISVAKEKTSTFNGSFGVGNSTSSNLKLTQTWSSGVTTTYKADATGFNICGYKGRWHTGVAKTQEVS